MSAATVIIPTHEHGETLRFSIPTALRQTVEDIEIFVIGDGVPDVSRAIAREFSAPFIDLGRPPHRLLFTNSKSGTVSEPTCAAHTMALYRRLPHGWRTTPPGFAPDRYMWAQCLADPRTTARSGARPTAILFPDPPRRRWPLQRRLDELRDWSARLDDARTVRPECIPDLVLRGYELSLHLPFGRRALAKLAKRFFPSP